MVLEYDSEETPTRVFWNLAELPTLIPGDFSREKSALEEKRAQTRIDAAPPRCSIVSSEAVSNSAPPSSITWAPGTIIPGTIYRTIRPLGIGGMGEVYEVEHELLGVRRALKVLHRRLINREDLAERLRIEARALARLRHSNLVEVNDLGTSADGRVFFAMELLSGATLRDLLRRTGAMNVQQTIAIATQLLAALDAAHQEGMVHRDVKPENVFVQRSGVVKLLDFGVAKALQGNTQLGPLTAAGVAIGTPRYMAPEQAQGQRVDARSDVYAVGLVLYEMLAGHPPYHNLDPLAAIVTAAAQGLPDISTVVVSIPEDLRKALCRATARNPEDRYASATSFAEDLRRIRARMDGSFSAIEKVTARYETSLTSLMPVLSEVTSHDDVLSVHDGSLLSPTHITHTATTPVNEDKRASVHPAEATEVLTLRDSIRFDLRDQPTPTSLPPVPSSDVAPSIVPSPTTSLRGIPWFILPFTIIVSVLMTWALLGSTPTSPSPLDRSHVKGEPSTSPVLVSSVFAAPLSSPPLVSHVPATDPSPEGTSLSEASVDSPAPSSDKASKTNKSEKSRSSPVQAADTSSKPSILPHSGL